MGIAMMIQLALQSATAAITLLQQLGYLEKKAHDQIMMTLVSAHPTREVILDKANEELHGHAQGITG